MPRITKVATLPVLEKPKRVAAYARVSSGKDAMLHSLSAQVSYYNDLIQHHTGWQFAGVYSDEAITGTKENREGFQRMLQECRSGAIDMVITKSISRFARNTVTLLRITRELEALGVDVFFEEQGIHTISAEGELLLTILASYAQEESLSASENQKWRIKHNFEEGIPWKGTIFGYRLKNGRYEIVPEEADIVRHIYAEYLSGCGCPAIAKQLNEAGIPTHYEKLWSQQVVSHILSNYTYTGNLLLQKTFRENHITKKTIVNRGEFPQYHAEGTHDAIIVMDTFRAVQEEKKHRAEHFRHEQAPKRTYPFTGLLVCDNCGKHYRRKVRKNGFVWICETLNTTGKAACASKQIPESVLNNITADILAQKQFSEELLRRRIYSILVCNGNRLVYCLANGTQIERTWQNRSRSESWTDEMKSAARQKSLQRRDKNA